MFSPILVVEDNPDHARLIIKTLKKSNQLTNEIIHLENGEKAVSFLKTMLTEKENLEPMLILLDVKLPLKNGFEVLEEIKSHSILKKIPVVMLTTTSNKDDIKKAMKLGANDYIIKPIQFSEFTEKVSKLGNYWSNISDAKKTING
ncbi:MAG: response regulator [Leptospiraceae bacterium]|nr:response regulator [Leptospiraceae bacterium]